MIKDGRLILSSLAVSVSAVSILAVSGVASADPPQQCNHGITCNLGWTSNWFLVYGSEEPEQQNPWYGQWNYGVCGIPDGYESCGCYGWKREYHMVGQFWYEDPNTGQPVYWWMTSWIDDYWVHQPGPGSGCLIP